MWGRLGYPRRAVRLRECAVAIVERHGGEVPDRAGPAAGAARGRHATPRGRWPRSRTGSGTRWSTRTSGGWCARAVAGEPDAGPATRPADLVATEELLPDEPAARGPGQRRVHGAGRGGLHRPRARAARTAPSSRSAPGGPPARPRRPARPAGPSGTPAPTGRCAACCSAVLREAIGPVPRQRLDLVWSDDVQRARALAGLVDGRPGGARSATPACWPATTLG